MTEKMYRKRKERRDRLDRFVAAALGGWVACPSVEATPEQAAAFAVDVAVAVLVELERCEREGGK